MGIEDKQFLTAIDAIARELESILIECNRRSNGSADKDTLIALRLEQMDILEESVKKNRRVLNFLAGRPVEPQVQFAEAILVGVGDQPQ
jgi:hypothetical protein